MCLKLLRTLNGLSGTCYYDGGTGFGLASCTKAAPGRQGLNLLHPSVAPHPYPLAHTDYGNTCEASRHKGGGHLRLLGGEAGHPA